MDFAGLVGKFKVDRPLSADERRHHLRQQERISIEPHYQLSVIAMNSTYLELVDKWYGEKGTTTGVTLTMLVMFGVGIGGSALWMLSKGILAPPGTENAWTYIASALALLAMLLPFEWMLWRLLRTESFAYTHYPLRFNRKTRKVHVFRPNGKVMTVSWDSIFFTLSQVDPLHKFWNILGHILEEDDNTVRETFALSVSEMGTPTGLLLMRSHWEFVRRYMEEGPAAVGAAIQFCLPISNRRETFLLGLHRLLANSGVSNWLLPIRIFLMAVAVVQAPFRFFAIRTSKIPGWPEDVELASEVKPADPYAIIGDNKGERVPVYPAAAEAIGFRFTGPPANPLSQQTPGS